MDNAPIATTETKRISGDTSMLNAPPNGPAFYGTPRQGLSWALPDTIRRETGNVRLWAECCTLAGRKPPKDGREPEMPEAAETPGKSEPARGGERIGSHGGWGSALAEG